MRASSPQNGASRGFLESRRHFGPRAASRALAPKKRAVTNGEAHGRYDAFATLDSPHPPPYLQWRGTRNL